MSIFIVIFITVYTLMHAYAFYKAKSALGLTVWTRTGLLLFMAIMILSPIIIRQSEKIGLDAFARVYSFIGYTWLALLFFFIFSSISIDVYRIIIKAVALIARRPLSAFLPSARVSFFIPLMLSMVICTYGYFEALDIRTEHITIKTSKLPKEIGRLRVAQISDVHVGLIVRESRIRRMLSAVKEANPDILVATGDLVDGQINDCSGLDIPFTEVNPRFGKFAINGNHEHYAGLAQAHEFMRKSGFKLLVGEYVEAGGIIVAGVDDLQAQTFGVYKGPEESVLLKDADKSKFVLLLKHQPRVYPSSFGMYDLQLSGHVHDGQLFPFVIFTKMAFNYYKGLYELPKGSKLYVNRGTGTWGPPIRFLAPPEVTIIDMVYSEEGN